MKTETTTNSAALISKYCVLQHSIYCPPISLWATNRPMLFYPAGEQPRAEWVLIDTYTNCSSSWGLSYPTDMQVFNPSEGWATQPKWRRDRHVLLEVKMWFIWDILRKFGRIYWSSDGIRSLCLRYLWKWIRRDRFFSIFFGAIHERISFQSQEALESGSEWCTFMKTIDGIRRNRRRVNF